MKIITICGSSKFKKEIMEIALKKELEGNVILTPIFTMDENEIKLNKEEQIIIGKMHKEKIKISDSILVANINGYIGNSTKSEIEYAKSLNKEIIYYTEI